MGWTQGECAAANKTLQTLQADLAAAEKMPNSPTKKEWVALLTNAIKTLGLEIGQNCRIMQGPGGPGPKG